MLSKIIQIFLLVTSVMIAGLLFFYIDKDFTVITVIMGFVFLGYNVSPFFLLIYFIAKSPADKVWQVCSYLVLSLTYVLFYELFTVAIGYGSPGNQMAMAFIAIPTVLLLIVGITYVFKS